jgi:hypothetical protein
MSTLSDRQGARKGTLKMVSLGTLRERKFPLREHVVGPWLRQSESAMLWSPTGLGKSMLAITIALAVAGGGKVCGWTFERPRRVLLIDGEMHIEDVRDRLVMLSATVDGLDVEAADRNLVVLCRQDQKPDVAFPDLATAKGQDAVIQRALHMKAELVIADNFSTLADVPDENDASAMTPVLSWLLRMKQAGIATILVHHSGKSNETYRGSSKLATTFEVIMGLHRLEGRTVADGTGFELRWGKFRGKPTTATRDAEMRLVETPEGHLEWAVAPAVQSELLALVEAVKTASFHTQRELAENLGWTPMKVSRGKKQAIAKGLITGQAWRDLMERDDEWDEGDVETPF